MHSAGGDHLHSTNIKIARKCGPIPANHKLLRVQKKDSEFTSV